jgi:hypothetical protein
VQQRLHQTIHFVTGLACASPAPTGCAGRALQVKPTLGKLNLDSIEWGVC